MSGLNPDLLTLNQVPWSFLGSGPPNLGSTLDPAGKQAPHCGKSLLGAERSSHSHCRCGCKAGRARGSQHQQVSERGTAGSPSLAVLSEPSVWLPETSLRREEKQQGMSWAFPPEVSALPQPGLRLQPPGSSLTTDLFGSAGASPGPSPVFLTLCLGEAQYLEEGPGQSIEHLVVQEADQQPQDGPGC